jgi:hypothetical protein
MQAYDVGRLEEAFCRSGRTMDVATIKLPHASPGGDRGAVISFPSAFVTATIGNVAGRGLSEIPPNAQSREPANERRQAFGGRTSTIAYGRPCGAADKRQAKLIIPPAGSR